MQSDRWLQLILPKKCARCFFLLSKNISCTETACLLLRIISLFKFWSFRTAELFGIQKFLQWIFCWANKNLTCSEIFLIWKQQTCFEELFFRVLELQNFFKSKILAMKIFFSKHKSSQMLKAAIQPTVFLWILYPLGIWHLQTG